MPRLPDASAFGERPEPQLSPGVVQVDATPIARQTMQQGDDIVRIGEIMMRGEQIARSKEEAVERTRILGEFETEGSKELQRVSTEGDLSRIDEVTKYGEFLNQRKRQAIEGYKGSREGQMQLLMRIEQSRSRLAGKAGTLSGKAQVAMLDDAIGRRGNDLAGRAYQNPGSLIELFREFDEHLGDMAPALTPEQETTYRKTYQGHMAQLALESLVTRGQFADAEAALQMPGISEVLGPDAQKTVRKQILDRKYALREAAMKGIAEATGRREGLRVMLGREPTDTELAQSAGVLPKTEKTEAMFGSGVTGRALEIMTNLAPAIQAGVATPEQQRQWEAATTQYTQPQLILDPDTGTMQTRRPELPPFAREAGRRGGQAQPQSSAGFPRVSPQEQAQRDVEARQIIAREQTGGGIPTSSVVEGSQDRRQTDRRSQMPQTIWGMNEAGLLAGPVAGATRGLSRTPVIGDMIGQTQSGQAAQFAQLANRDLVRVLQNNPRFAEGERKQIETELSINPKVMDTSTALRDRLIAVDNALEVRYQNAVQTMNNPRTDKEDRQYAMTVANAIPQYRKTLGLPPKVRNDADFNSLPSGSQFIDPEGKVRVKP